jgi:hypothetical protein
MTHNITTKRIEAGNYGIYRNGKEAGNLWNSDYNNQWVVTVGVYAHFQTDTKGEALRYLRNEFDWDAAITEQAENVANGYWAGAMITPGLDA